MREKKRKDAAPKKTAQNDTQSMNYEELLNGFAFEGEAKDDTAVTRGDLDGLALAELLGGEEQQTVENASGSFDTIAAGDYSSLARQFDALDLSLLAEDAEEEKKAEAESPGEDTVGEIDFAALSIDEAKPAADDQEEAYLAILDELEKAPVTTPLPAEEPDGINLFDLELPEEMALEAAASGEADLMNLPALDDPAPDEPAPENIAAAAPEIEAQQASIPAGVTEEQAPERNVLDIVNLADDSEFSEETMRALQAYTDAEASEKPESEPVGMAASVPEPEKMVEPEEDEGVFSLTDLFDETDPSSQPGTTAIKTPLRPPKSIAEPKPDIQPGKTEVDFLGLSSVAPAAKAPKRTDVSMEVLFEGVEMSFSEQIDVVTLGELLLAQGKKKEAADCFQEVAKRKGTTNWVAKRLRLLASNIEK